MNNKVLVFTIVIFIFLYCTQKKDETSANESTIMALSQPDSLRLEKKKLAETILNHPDVVRYSRLRNVRKVFDTIFITFNEYDSALPPYIQQGDTLKLINKNDSINSLETPVYELEKIHIIGDSAYVYLEFDISGAVAYGSLKQINEQWVPDSAFIIGVR